MKLLKRYLAKEIVSSILLITLGLLAMFSFFDLIQELENIGKGTYGIGQVLIFVLLSAPGHVYEVVPVAVLVGTMYALGQFSRYSELIVLRVSGVSVLSIMQAWLAQGKLSPVIGLWPVHLFFLLLTVYMFYRRLFQQPLIPRLWRK